VPAAVAILEPGEAYRRQARRLRCRFASHPGRLQQSLKRLAAETPAPTSSPSLAVTTQTHIYPACVQSGPARRFADYLLEETRGPLTVLRYSQRLEFLRAARRLGVGRFEANLLIAAVVERRTAARPAERAESETESAPDSLLGRLTAFLLIEAAVLLSFWWALFH
jgi:hypothetical protein